MCNPGEAYQGVGRHAGASHGNQPRVAGGGDPATATGAALYLSRSSSELELEAHAGVPSLSTSSQQQHTLTCTHALAGQSALYRRCLTDSANRRIHVFTGERL
jgi:hypothetical protein